MGRQLWAEDKGRRKDGWLEEESCTAGRKQKHIEGGKAGVVMEKQKVAKRQDGHGGARRER